MNDDLKGRRSGSSRDDGRWRPGRRRTAVIVLHALFSMVGLAAIGLAAAGCSGASEKEGGAVKENRAGAGTVERGRMISSALIGRKSASAAGVQLNERSLAASPRCGVALYKIVYETIDPSGRTTIASGALAIPEGIDGPFPVVSSQHGTVANRSTVASEYGFDLASLLFGSDGYVVVIPDYLGLGESPGLHPYVHASSLATSIVDMLRASRAFCAEKKIPLNGELFLTGYSEGGYATMAAHRELEEKHAAEFSVTAAAPMAGPYDMSGTMRELFLNERRYADPFYLPYVLLAYQNIYRLAGSLDAIFVEPYASSLPKLFNGENEGFIINENLPDVPTRMLTPEFLRALRSDSLAPLNRILRENDLYRWTPRAPMRIYHCVGDNHVPYKNAEVAYRSFRERGATQVELIRLDNGGHGACFLPSIRQGKEWFDSMRR